MADYPDFIVGASDLVAWFGSWPTFHDAEVLALECHAGGTCSLRLKTWQMTSELDARGFYVLQKHVIVDFQLEALDRINLIDFAKCGVIFGLTASRIQNGLHMELHGCYGLCGTLAAKGARLEFMPTT